MTYFQNMFILVIFLCPGIIIVNLSHFGVGILNWEGQIQTTTIHIFSLDLVLFRIQFKVDSFDTIQNNAFFIWQHLTYLTIIIILKMMKKFCQKLKIKIITTSKKVVKLKNFTKISNLLISEKLCSLFWFLGLQACQRAAVKLHYFYRSIS